MPVDHLYVKPERAELLVNRFRTADLFDRAVDLQAVVVHDQAQVIQLLMACEHRGLPNLTFFDLAVAEHGIHAVILAVELSGERDPAGSGNALSKRSGAHINTGDRLHIRMALKQRTQMTQALELLRGKIAALRKGGVQAGAAVALGEDKAVPVGIMGIAGIDIHFLEIEVGIEIRGGKRAAGMSGFRVESPFNDAHPDFTSLDFEIFLLCLFHRSPFLPAICRI